MADVTEIHFGDEAEREILQAPRFFDAAPIPGSLWVRVSFVDGKVVEGMIANSWSSFHGDLLEVRLLDQQGEERRIQIPRTSIAELQVITTR